MRRKKYSNSYEIEIPDRLIHAVLNQCKVNEAPHDFYKYPARFSPVFAREAINAFTEEGETILDPFCGGGTSLVEAISLGRKAAGFDISSLAVFLTRVKTSPLSVHDIHKILEWLQHIEKVKNSISKSGILFTAEEIHYHRNLPKVPKAFFEMIINCTYHLPKEKQRSFVRLVLLSVGQWALDCKIKTPTRYDLQIKFAEQLQTMIEQQYQFLGRAAIAHKIPRCYLTRTRRIINGSSEHSDEDKHIPKNWLPARLVLTSPPYPGVHVVYHRWQINGRKETPAPFWLANTQDGSGEAYYCLGRRDEPELKTYFDRLKRAYSAVKKLLNKESIVVQLVAFSDTNWQLTTYLDKMEEAGFRELKPVCDTKYLFEGRIWRQIPGRKWYATGKEQTTSSREVLLLHKPIF
jgi:DNA modification methylase